MMRLRVEKISDGPGPSEVVVRVKTAQNVAEQLVVHSTAIVNDMIDIGYPIHQKDEQLLVELPRETATGRWRVWVPKAHITASDSN